MDSAGQMSTTAGIEHRFARVSFVTALATAFSVVCQIVSVPICLHYWGKNKYGAWLALVAASTLMRTVDGGYIGYVGNKLNLLYHRNDNALRQTLASAIWGVAILGTFQLLVLVTLYATDSMGYLMDTAEGSVTAREATVALAVLSISWVLSGSYLGVLHRLLIPVGLMYQAAWWSMAFQLSQFGALVAAALAACSILQAAVLFAFTQGTVYLASAVYIRFKLPRYYPWWSKPSARIGLNDLLGSAPLTIGGVLQQGGNSGLVLLVSALLGAAAVPIFATMKTLTNLWITLVNVLTTPLLPDIVRFYAKGEVQKLVGVHQAHWLLVGSAVNLSILIAYPFLGPVYAAWTRHNLPFDPALLCMLLATVSLTGMTSLMNMFLSGVNHSGYILVSASLRGVVALLLGSLMLRRFGLFGLGLAMAAAEGLVLLVSIGWFFKREVATPSPTGDPVPITNWLWLSPGCTVGYFIVESFGVNSAGLLYCFALAGVATGSIATYRRLEPGVKARVRCLLSTIPGVSILVKVAR